jgi:hypothetical protein
MLKRAPCFNRAVLSVPVLPATNGTAGHPKDKQDQSDYQDDDPDGPQNRDLGEEAGYQQDDAQNDHVCS